MGISAELGREGKVVYEVTKKEWDKGTALIVSIILGYIAWMLLTTLF